MDCPKCKYPNVKGATYCGMCYEPFNVSAAKTYLHAVRQANRLAEQKEKEASSIDVQGNLKAIDEAFGKVDWIGGAKWLRAFSTTYKKPLLYLLGVCAAVPLIFLVQHTAVHFHSYRFVYAYETQPTRYLVGYHTTVKSWSERQDQLDTPMGDYKIDEIGNVMIQAQAPAKRGPQTLNVSVAEWIRMTQGEASASQPIPLNHPSLAPGTVRLDDKGRLLERHLTLTPRLAKSIAFIFPSFPASGTRSGRSFIQPVDWVELFGEWKVRWTGQLRWTVEDEQRCGPDDCAHLTYVAEITPQLWGVPDWAKGAVRKPRFDGTARGDLLFDTGHHRVFANTYAAEGVLRIPIDDLSLIPAELRVGRRVPEFPGVIVMQVRNQIDVRRN